MPANMEKFKRKEEVFCIVLSGYLKCMSTSICITKARKELPNNNHRGRQFYFMRMLVDAGVKFAVTLSLPLEWLRIKYRIVG